ncbi:cohesin domain-containing protein [Methylomonas sp. MgM2]
MNRLSLCYVLAAGLGLGGYQLSAEAMSISFQPLAQTVNVGDALVVDVVVSGLLDVSEIVSAFDLDVTYDPSILDATDVIFGQYLGAYNPDPMTSEFYSDAVLSSGRIDFFALSYLFDADLALIQSGMDSLSLATLSFQALGAGTSNLLFDPVPYPGIDVKGYDATALALDVSAASVTVAASSNVPEPSTLWLCLLGAMAFARRYQYLTR